MASTGVEALENQKPLEPSPATKVSADIEAADAAFSPWAKPATPGCALGVLEDGRMLYSHGYGFADVEHSVPITPTTVFHVASVSKQFTAFAIYMLASVSSRDGRLFVRYPRGETELKPTVTNMFEAEFPFGTVNYRCSADNRCDTFTVTDGRVRRLRFDRVDLRPVSRPR
jgi:hypothetical protein